MSDKILLRALAGETLAVPPAWMMRQAGRYLPEYRAVRERAGDFLTLCYTPELAAEVTLQPIRRFGFDAAILFADILLVPHALGADLWFVPGEGPRLSRVTTPGDLAALRPAEAVAGHLACVGETLAILRGELPRGVALIGFAGAPWTVASYMIAGRGTPDQGPAHDLMASDGATFDGLMARLEEATIRYLSLQIAAGAEVVMLFDSWAGSLAGAAFDRYALDPARRIIAALSERHPGTPVIAFPREAGGRLCDFTEIGAACLALDTSVDAGWAAAALQPKLCVQGNLDPALMVEGGARLTAETRRIARAFAHGPHVFNLGHGITPEADPDNVHRMLEALRGG